MRTCTDTFGFRLGVIARKLSRLYNKKYFKKYGLTTRQTWVVMELLANEGIGVKELASRLDLDSSAITGFIDRLAKEDLVERFEDANDRRSQKIYLTLKGRKLAEEILPVAQQFHVDVESVFTPKELDLFNKLLIRFEQGITDSLQE